MDFSSPQRCARDIVTDFAVCASAFSAGRARRRPGGGRIIAAMKPRWKPNVTVAAIVEQGGRYLLVEEQTDDGLLLNNPAGHLDEGESLVDACIRETLEETTHAFTPTELVGIYQTRRRRAAAVVAAEADDGSDAITYLRFAFCGTLGAVQPGRQLDDGIVRTLWMTPDEIRACRHRHRSPLLLACVEDHLAGRRHPLSLLHADASLRARQDA